jgi:hypothetical protein
LPDGLSNIVEIAAGPTVSFAVGGDGSPRIKFQPIDRDVLFSGATLVQPIKLSAAAVGAPPLSCQWQLNGVDVPGATNRFLATIEPGAYQLIVTNTLGAVTSRVATVTISEPLETALDGLGLSWVDGGNAAWSGQTRVTHESRSAAQSGQIGDDERTSMETVVIGPGTLSFWWKVSSEENFDYLVLSIDGIKHATISGEVDWERKEVRLPSGTHTVRFILKDVSSIGGLDAAWVDEVAFVRIPGDCRTACQPYPARWNPSPVER